MWFDAYDDITVTTTDGVTVTGWKDKSGNGRNTTIQPGPVLSQYPTYSSNGFNGRPGIFFNGAALITANISPTPVLSSNATDTTVFIVLNNPGGVFSSPFGLSNDAQYQMMDNWQYSDRHYFGFGGTYQMDNYQFVIQSGPQIYSITKLGSSTNWYNFGSNVASSGTAGTITSTSQPFYVGGWGNGRDGNYTEKSYIGELIVYNRALTTNERQQVEGYLAWTWGLQSRLQPGHPALTNPPFPFTSPLSVNPIAWYDAADATTITLGGTNVQKWNDKTGKGYNLSLGSGTITYSNTALGQSINLSGGYMFSTSLANLQTYALFTVLGSPKAVSNQAVITGRPNTATSYGSTDGFGLYVDSSGTPQLRLYGNSGGSNINTVSGTGVSLSAMYPVIASYTGAANGVISSWINGNDGTVTTTGINRTISGQGFAIGAEWTGTAYTNLSAVTSLYEIVVMSNVPTTIQRQQMEGYLAWKWGLQANLPTSHPYKTFTPVGPVPSYTTTNIINVSDKSGYGNFLTSNSTLYPTYVSSAKGIYFGPNAALSNPFVMIPPGYSMFAVTSLSYTTDYARLVNIGLNNFNGVMGTGSGATFGGIIGNGTSWNNGTVALTPATDVTTYPTRCIVELTFSGGTVYAPYFNGNGLSTLSSAGQITISGINFGQLPSVPTQIWPGYLHEFLLVSQKLQPLQRQQLEGYLAWKWNLSSQLPTGHLFKNASPIQATISSQIQPSYTTSNVINWADKSGYVNFLTSNSISYPTYISSAKGIYFGPNASFSNPFVNIPAGYTMISVASLSYTPTTSNQLVNIGPTNAYAYMGTYTGTAQFATFDGNGSVWNSGTTVANTPTSAVSPYPSLTLMEMNVCGSTLTPYFNGSAMVTKTGTTAAAQGIQIGGFGDVYNWTGFIHEFLLVSQQLQPLQRQQLEGYLAWKWNISSQLPAGHLFKNASPIQSTLSSQIQPSYTTSNVINWADKSGYVNFLTSNSVAYPTFNLSAKGIYFGPDAALSNPFVKIPAGYTMFAIASLTSTPSDYGRLMNIGTTNYNGYMGTYSNSPNYQTFIGTGGSWNAPFPSAPSPAVPVATYPQLSMLELTFSGGTTYTPYVNGSGLPGISSAGAASLVTGINFGQLPPGSTQPWPWTGYLHEFLLVSQLLTSGQRQQMEGYLAWKWNISSQLPTGHPYRSSSSIQPYPRTNNIKGIADKSGFGNNFTLVPSSINYPQYSSTYNGIYLGISASFVNSTLPIPAGYTMMAVASLSTTPGAYGRLINVGQGDYAGFLGTYGATVSFATFTGTGSAWNDLTANTPATPVSTNPVLPSILEMTVCGTVLNPFFNGADMSAKVGTTVATTGMIIGATANNGGQFWPGYINELLLVPRTLTILQRQQMEGYLAWKWGLQGNLPSTHPFKLGPP
jgi:hypothetical protein